MKITISQNDAKKFLDCPKFYCGDKTFEFPSIGEYLKIPLHSLNQETEFELDIHRKSFSFKKHTYQNRIYKSIVLLRLDIGGSPHRNPDNEVINSSHIHIYKEGFDDKWAYSLPDIFANLTDPYDILMKFMEYCNIEKKPDIFKTKLF